MKEEQMHADPAFWLVTSMGEGFDLGQPRACYPLTRYPASGRDDYLLVRIDPPAAITCDDVAGWVKPDRILSHIRSHSLPESPNRMLIERLILGCRHAGYSLFPVSDWPTHVYVFLRFDEVPDPGDTIQQNDLFMLAWGLIWPSVELATNPPEEKSIQKFWVSPP